MLISLAVAWHAAAASRPAQPTTVTDIAGFLAALLATLGLTPVLARRAERWGLLDHPDARKQHHGPVPMVGGLAMGIAFLASWFAAGHASQGLAAAGAVALTLVGGVLDDRHDHGAGIKFGFQITAALLLALGANAQLTHLGHLMSEELFTLGRWSLPLTVFAIVGIMNALNMADGLDGLAGSLALVACLAFGVAGLVSGQPIALGVVCLVAGVLLGFLAFNARTPWRPRALVFMGDTGSLMLGLLLAWVAIKLAMSDPAGLAPITAVWIVGLPIADTVTIMTRRALRGASPFKADREHLHHILSAAGIPQSLVVPTIALFAAVLAAIGIAAPRMGVAEHVLFYAYVTGLVVYGTAAEWACRKLGIRKVA